MKLKKDTDKFILIHFEKDKTNVIYSNVTTQNVAYAAKILEVDAVKYIMSGKLK